MQNFLKHDVTEQEKVQVFLDLIMNSDKDRKIYLHRWESVKDAKVFSKNGKKGFATTFKREEFKDIATKIKGSKIRTTFNKIKDFVYTKDERGEREDNART